MNYINEFNNAFFCVINIIKQFLPISFCLAIPIALIMTYIDYKDDYKENINNEKQSESDICR